MDPPHAPHTDHQEGQQTDLNREQFSSVVKKFLACHARVKALNKEAKEVRAQMNDLKVIIISFMEGSSLEVCKVSHADKSGELALRNAKRTRSLKKDDAINHIEQFLSGECGIDGDVSGERAMKLWEGMQATRESTEVIDLSVRKV